MKRKKVLVFMISLVLTISSFTGTAFADVDFSQWDSQASYPKDIVNTPLFPAVKYLIDKKVFTGYSDGTFRPGNNITRAEVAVAITKMTNRTNELDTMAERNIFSDLSGYDWAKGYINTMVEVGVIKGITANTYEPGKNISYAEMITMMIRTKGGAASEIESYGTWPNNYIQYAQMYNLLGDITVTDWNAPAPRGDVAKVMYRMMR